MKTTLDKICNDISKLCDSALVDAFYKMFKYKENAVDNVTDKEGNIDTDNELFQITLRDFFELNKSDYQIDKLKTAFSDIYDSSYDNFGDKEEAYEKLQEEKTSPQKERFINYCKDKIQELGDVTLEDDEDIHYRIVMHTPGIREFTNLYILVDFEDTDFEDLLAVDDTTYEKRIETKMIDFNQYAATLQFDIIDTAYYNNVLKYWGELYMDELIDNNAVGDNEETALEESKDNCNESVEDIKYNVYILEGEDGVYNSSLIDTVDSKEQAEDRVAELQAETGSNAYYKKVVNGIEEDSVLDDDEDIYTPVAKRCLEIIQEIESNKGRMEIYNDYSGNENKLAEWNEETAKIFWDWLESLDSDDLVEIYDDREYYEGDDFDLYESKELKIEGENYSEDSDELDKKVKEYYLEEFPNEEDFVKNTPKNITFRELYDRMQKGEDVYDILDIGDSVVRERIFDELSRLLDVDYDVIYKLWLSQDDIKKSNKIKSESKSNWDSDGIYINGWHLEEETTNGGITRYWLYNTKGLGGSLIIYPDTLEEFEDYLAKNQQVIGFEGNYLPDTIYNKIIKLVRDGIIKLRGKKEENKSSKTESVKDNNSIIIHTGLSDPQAKDILNSVIGQLSDGIWENTFSMNRYWQYMDVDKEGNEIIVRFNRDDYRSGFRGKDENQIRKWLANKIKQIVKEEGLEWDRNNTQRCAYLDRGNKPSITVQDAYRVYDRILGRKDRISFDEKKLGGEIMKKMNLTEATTLALEGKLKESKNIEIGDNKLEYNDVDDLCAIITIMIDVYDSFHGKTDIIQDILGYSIEELLNDNNSYEHSISYMTLDPNVPAWEATEEVLIPVKDENEALNIITEILKACEDDGIDLDEFYEEIEVNYL